MKKNLYSSPQQKSTSWGNVASWYDALLEEQGNTFQEKVIGPALDRIIAPAPDKKILDIACGQGFFSRRFAAVGAAVTASDISPELIALAKKNSAPSETKISYHVAPADDCSFAPDNFFDSATCILALQNIERVAPVMQEVARVLRPGGKFIFVINHPAFRNPKFSEWGWDEQRGAQYRRVDAYITEHKQKIEMHPGDDPTAVTFSFHRPLQLYVKHLAKAGFAITHLEEWSSHKKSASGPRAGAENKSRHEIPLFMCVIAQKIKNESLSSVKPQSDSREPEAWRQAGDR